MMRLFPEEIAHDLALLSLKILHFLGFKIPQKNNANKISLKGITFFNKLGLAAGLDKNGDYIDPLASLGFGFLEIGTVTPRPQKGNPKPRLFRVSSQEALVNSLGFNNKGVDYLVAKVSKRKSSIPLGISIGKNSDTPLEKAKDDYLMCLEKVFPYADYIAINISSPNTEGLRDLFNKEYFSDLISSLKLKQIELSEDHKYVPLFLKISPNIDSSHLKLLVEIILEKNIDGIICTNTSNVHDHFSGKGGISGKPLLELSSKILVTLRSLVGKNFPIIASGGVMCAGDFQRKLDCGADLVQIYTGLIYRGPSLVDEIVNSD
jgi:dihydroorotate dehydrogenase|tara:strand:- start:187 stop:1146 length:960 start_codon:yes stop_codon:yes gene_type:complete